MTDEDRAHQLGDEFRATARTYRREFVNWIALASAGGIGLLMSFIATAPDKTGALHLLVPALIAWLVAVICAAGTLFGMIQEADGAAASFHRQGRRERQKMLLASLEADDPQRPTVKMRIVEHHRMADVYHRASRRWLFLSHLLLTMAGISFLTGAILPIYALLVQNPLALAASASAPVTPPHQQDGGR